MKLTFQELGIDLSTLDGQFFYYARQQVIQIAADRITCANYGHPSTCIETLYDWINAKVCFFNYTIDIPNTNPVQWCAINQ